MGNPQSTLKEELIEKLYSGSCTQNELVILFRLIKEDPSPPDPRLMEKLWQETDVHNLSDELSDRIFSKVLSKAGLDVSTTVAGKRQDNVIIMAPDSGWKVPWRVIAAVFLGLIAFSTWILVQTVEKEIIQTAFGEVKSLQLSDGSNVRLNANSQMVFDAKWSDTNSREVWLEGEAFFEVKKKPEYQQKFHVKTHDLTIEVLGTAFNVNSHRDKTSVYLEEGEIRLYFNELDSSILMQPGDLIVYSKSNGKIINQHQVQTELYTSWKEGVLIFNDSPLRQVLEKIEETYGVQFQVNDETIYLREINFPLPIDELETAISILNKTMGDLEIRKEGDYYLIE